MNRYISHTFPAILCKKNQIRNGIEFREEVNFFFAMLNFFLFIKEIFSQICLYANDNYISI